MYALDALGAVGATCGDRRSATGGRGARTADESRLARGFLAATAGLPAIRPRTLFLDESTRAYFTESAAGKRTEPERRRLKPVPVDESIYYTTKYGSPLAYVRPIDLLGQAGLDDVWPARVLDFGYGTIGHLRLLAGLGADVTGVDVDPLLPALYSRPEDQGVIKNARGRDGRIRLIDGRFPADHSVRSSVGRTTTCSSPRTRSRTATSIPSVRSRSGGCSTSASTTRRSCGRSATP